jgi:hypothetical protein
LMSLNQKVTSPMSASFVIIRKKWWIPNKSDESSIHLDEYLCVRILFHPIQRHAQDENY